MWLLNLANCLHRKQDKALWLIFHLLLISQQPHSFHLLPKGVFNDTESTIGSRLQVRLCGGDPLGTSNLLGTGGGNPIGTRAGGRGWDRTGSWASSSPALLEFLVAA